MCAAIKSPLDLKWSLSKLCLETVKLQVFLNAIKFYLSMNFKELPYWFLWCIESLEFSWKIHVGIMFNVLKELNSAVKRTQLTLDYYLQFVSIIKSSHKFQY